MSSGDCIIITQCRGIICEVMWWGLTCWLKGCYVAFSLILFRFLMIYFFLGFDFVYILEEKMLFSILLYKMA